MASHGKKRHLKRLAVPPAQPILRKAHLWLVKSMPGAHNASQSVPLLVLLRDMLKVAHSSWEAKTALHSKLVFVDGRPVSSPKFPVGLMDVVTVPKLNLAYVVVNVKGKLATSKVEKTGSKLCKVTGKRFIGKGKIQLAFHDGRSILVPDKVYKVGDSLRVSVPKQEIKEHLKLEKGARCYVFKGRHAGSIGKLLEVLEFPGITRANAKIAGENGGEITTLKDYVFVVDKEFKV